MKLKKYIVLSHKHEYNATEGHYDSLKIKVVEGFTRDKIEEALDVQKGWTPLGNDQDKLYFMPGCAVPRFKVREHYSCTIKPANATAAFVSKTNLLGSDTTLDFYNSLYPVSLEDLKPFLKNMTDQATSKLIESIANSIDYEDIFLSIDLWKERTYNTSFCQNAGFKLYDIMDTSRYTFKDQCVKPQYNLLGYKRNSAFSNCTVPIYFEDELLSVLNKDNFIIDEEKYEELRSFGLTEDKENEVLMMELMCNCDFEKSIVYLLFLLKEFGQNIKDYKEASHVNFKSLLSFIDIDKSKINKIDLNTMTRILRKHKKFTRMNAMKISGLCTASGEYIDYNDANNLCWTQGPVFNPDCNTLLNTEEKDA